MIAMQVFTKCRHHEDVAPMTTVATRLGVFVAFPARRIHYVPVWIVGRDHSLVVAHAAKLTSSVWVLYFGVHGFAFSMKVISGFSARDWR